MRFWIDYLFSRSCTANKGHVQWHNALPFQSSRLPSGFHIWISIYRDLCCTCSLCLLQTAFDSIFLCTAFQTWLLKWRIGGHDRIRSLFSVQCSTFGLIKFTYVEWHICIFGTDAVSDGLLLACVVMASHELACWLTSINLVYKKNIYLPASWMVPFGKCKSVHNPLVHSHRYAHTGHSIHLRRCTQLYSILCKERAKLYHIDIAIMSASTSNKGNVLGDPPLGLYCRWPILSEYWRFTICEWWQSICQRCFLRNQRQASILGDSWCAHQMSRMVIIVILNSKFHTTSPLKDDVTFRMGSKILAVMVYMVTPW